MTFANLKKNKEATQKIYNPIDQLKEEKPNVATNTAEESADLNFTQEQVEGEWINMCMKMQSIKDLIGLANRMKSITPKITTYPNIDVVIDNQLLLNDLQKIKGRIIKTFKIGLQNKSLTMDFRLAEQAEVTKVLSKREVLEQLMESNPSIAKLTEKLKLVMV